MEQNQNEKRQESVRPAKNAFHQADQVVAQIKVGMQQNQVNLETLRNILIAIQTRASELEQALKLSTEKNHSLVERFSLSQKELQRTELRIRELENLTENYKRNLQESRIEHSRVVDQNKAEISKNQMIKQTFENYVDYAAKSTADKIRDFEEETKNLKLLLSKKDEQLKMLATQVQEGKLKIQILTRKEQELEKKLQLLTAENAESQRKLEQRLRTAEQNGAAEKNLAQRSFDQRLQAAEQSLLKERTLRKALQDRITPLDQEIGELRQLNESLKNTLKLEQVMPAAPTDAQTTAPVEPPPFKDESASGHRIEETSDGAVLVWN